MCVGNGKRGAHRYTGKQRGVYIIVEGITRFIAVFSRPITPAVQRRKRPTYRGHRIQQAVGL